MTATANPASHFTDSIRRRAAKRFSKLIPTEGRKMAALIVKRELKAKVRFRFKLHRCTLYRWAKKCGMVMP